MIKRKDSSVLKDEYASAYISKGSNDAIWVAVVLVIFTLLYTYVL